MQYFRYSTQAVLYAIIAWFLLIVAIIGYILPLRALQSNAFGVFAVVASHLLFIASLALGIISYKQHKREGITALALVGLFVLLLIIFSKAIGNVYIQLWVNFVSSIPNFLF